MWNFKNTMLKKRKKKNKERKQTNQQKQCRKNYEENIGTKLISNTKKHKLKILSRVWNFKNTMLKKRKKKTKYYSLDNPSWRTSHNCATNSNFRVGFNNKSE